jgi:hypothetical protein
MDLMDKWSGFSWFWGASEEFELFFRTPGSHIYRPPDKAPLKSWVSYVSQSATQQLTSVPTHTCNMLIKQPEDEEKTQNFLTCRPELSGTGT